MNVLTDAGINLEFPQGFQIKSLKTTADIIDGDFGTSQNSNSAEYENAMTINQ